MDHGAYTNLSNICSKAKGKKKATALNLLLKF